MPRYPYSRISLPFSETFLKFKNAPLLKVGIVASSGAMVKPLAYIDTGAQICIFDNSYAKQLGIKDYKDTKGPEDKISLSLREFWVFTDFLTNFLLKLIFQRGILN